MTSVRVSRGGDVVIISGREITVTPDPTGLIRWALRVQTADARRRRATK